MLIMNINELENKAKEKGQKREIAVNENERANWRIVATDNDSSESFIVVVAAAILLVVVVDGFFSSLS